MERMRRLRAEKSVSTIPPSASANSAWMSTFAGQLVAPSAIEGTRLQFSRAVIATGARAAEPSIPGLAIAGYYTNETIFTLTALPHRMVVMGAGPVGCELAQSFQRFGCQVILITDGAEILPKEDRDAAAVVRHRMSREGVRIITGGIIERVSSNGSAKRVSVAAAGTTHDVECDAILVSVGRRPNLEGLAFETAGVEYTSQGVVVDNRLRTTPTPEYTPRVTSRDISLPMPLMRWRAS